MFSPQRRACIACLPADVRRLVLATAMMILCASGCRAASMPASDVSEMMSKPAKITKGPYLLRVYQDRAAIMWETDSEGACGLYYGEPGKTESRIESAGQRVSYRSGLGITRRVVFIHKVWVDHLQPGLTYTYRIEGLNLRSKDYQFRTVPAEANEVTFVVYGDSRTDPKTHRKLVELIIEKHPAFVVNVGDLATSGDTYSQWGAQYFEPLKGLAETVPVYTAKGNHEGNRGNYERLLVPAGDKNNYSFDYGPVHYFCADNISTGVNRRALLDQMSADARGSKAAWKFISCHVPSINFGGHWSDWGQPDTLEVLAKADVDLVITGHSHQYERFWPIEPPDFGEGSRAAGNDGYVTYITSGGGGAPLSNVTPCTFHACAKKVYHFCLFHIKGNQLTMDAIDVDGRVIDRLEITKDNGQPNKSYLWSAVPMSAVALHQQLHNIVATPLDSKPTKDQSFTVSCKAKLRGVGKPISMTFQLKSQKGDYELTDARSVSVPETGGVVEVKLTATALKDVTLAKDKLGDGWPILPALRLDCYYEIGRVRETITWPVTVK